jgi:translocation and assembly module TamA
VAVQVGIAGCAHDQQQHGPVIRDLTIDGTRAVSPRQIKKKILTSKTGWWPFAHKEYFDPVTWEADLKRIVRLYMARGLYQARIEGSAVKPLENGVALEVKVDEGEPTRVASVEVQGLDALPPADQAAARDGLSLRVGQTFDEGSWESSKSGIVSKLRARGYYRAAAAGEALVGENTHEAKLTIVVRPGIAYRFGAIDVKAPPAGQIPPVLVWDQTRLAIPEGQLFNDDALDEAQRRVFGMGVFSTVRVTPGTPDDATGRLPVVVTVREAPFRTLRAGGGLKIDQIHQEARLIGEWSHRNFLGGLRKLTIHAEAGWAFLPTIWDVAANNQSVAPLKNGPVADFSVSFEQPRFLGHPSLREQNSVELQRTLQQTYDNLAGRFGTGVIWQPRARISIFPAYRLEGDYLNGAPINSAASAPLTLGCQTSTGSCLVWLSYLEQTITWDHRDKPLEPRNGFYAGLSLQEGGGPLQGNFSYLRALPDVRGYVSFLDDGALTLSARLRVGELWPTSGNPEDSAVVIRFYGGGANSMRGFSERRLSPLLLAPAPGTSSQVFQTVPIGGNGLLDGSYEARYSLTESLRLAGFLDFGQVTTGLIGPGDLGDTLWAAGIGIRYITSIGPIRVDLARRLPFGTLPPLYRADQYGNIFEDPTYSPDWSCFGLFASRGNTPGIDSACVLQISIGEAF